MKRSLLILLFSAISLFKGISQNTFIDSIKIKLLAYAKEDTQKVGLLLNLGRQYILQGDFDSAHATVKRAEDISQKETTVSDPVKRQRSIIFTYYGLIAFNQGNYPEALKNYFLSLKLREELNDKKGIAATYHNMGNVYYSQENREEAMKCYQSSLKIKRGLGDTMDSHYSHTINNLGNFYEHKKEYAQARKYYELAFNISKKLDDAQGIISGYCNLGNLLIFEDKYEESISYYMSALKIAEEAGDKQSIGAIYNSLGNLYLKLGRFPLSMQCLHKGLALATEIGSLSDEMTSYDYLTDLTDSLGDYKASLKYYKLLTAAKDSLNNEENTRKSVRLEMNYEFEKKETATKQEQEKKEAIAKTESRKQQIILWSVCGILLLVIGFAVFAYRSFLQKRKANDEILHQKNIIEEKQKEILDSINYARRIQMAQLPSELYISRTFTRLLKN